MSITKAFDVSHVRFSAPELNKMKAFLLDFGMAEVSQTNEKLVMRGHGPAPFCHVTEKGEPSFKGFGIWLNSIEELEALASHEKVQIQDYPEPGGGKFISIVDPDGFVLEVVAGQSKVAPLSTDKHKLWNQAGEYPRQNAPRRVKQGPAHVLRLGHVVIGVSDFRTSEAWYKERFGFVTSDEIEMAPGQGVGAFMRCDRGDLPCDHHTVFIMQRPIPAGFMHAAFEVADVDDLLVGHDHLQSKDYKAHWGVGRHILGSQVFDYWLDPWGHEVEHWTDGDQLVAADGSNISTFQELVDVQWGMKMPPIPEA